MDDSIDPSVFLGIMSVQKHYFVTFASYLYLIKFYGGLNN
jgi:hypothetical protein